MTIANYAIVDGSGNVTNIIVSDGTFTPASGSTLVAVGDSGAQIGWTYANSTFTNPSPPPSPTDAQIAVAAGNAALAAGINISSTSTPAMNGVFALTQQSQNDVNAVATYIVINGTFPQGQTTTYWAQKDGTIIEFPSVAVFNAFATAIADYVDAIEDYQNSGGEVGSLPSANVTII